MRFKGKASPRFAGVWLRGGLEYLQQPDSESRFVTDFTPARFTWEQPGGRHHIQIMTEKT